MSRDTASVTVEISGFAMTAGSRPSFSASSGSMEPTIHIDDLIIVTEQEDYKENDIIEVYELVEIKR